MIFSPIIIIYTMHIDIVVTWCGSKSMCDPAKDLWFCLRFIEKNAAWCRKVFVITADDDPIPEHWIPSNLVIQTVMHSDFIPQHLYKSKTVNSNMIESWVCHIRGLSNHFVFMHDDMFIVRPTAPDMFFDNAMQPIRRMAKRRARLNAREARISDASWQFWGQLYGDRVAFHGPLMQHQPQPYHRKSLTAFFRPLTILGRHMRSVRRAHAINALKIAASLATNDVVVQSRVGTELFVKAGESKRIHNALRSNRLVFLCVNNTSSSSTANLYKELIQRYELSTSTMFRNITLKHPHI
jgi:hypothetical protein